MVAAASVLGAAAPAPAAPRAANGQVVVFSTELQPLDVYNNPSGCQQLPTVAHVLSNQTDRPVQVYGNPFCVGPSAVVQPGFGTHVPGGAGSFSA
ncbi:hypothetical protein ACIQF6_31990 [Kitasatospora sp. NPDC092948]|uniref:hypothetical protein n=1 Tax=Kitasatospora sp. NPDC092948 TaxID=3364088 RepID=UPI0037FF7B92